MNRYHKGGGPYIDGGMVSRDTNSLNLLRYTHKDLKSGIHPCNEISCHLTPIPGFSPAEHAAMLFSSCQIDTWIS